PQTYLAAVPASMIIVPACPTHRERSRSSRRSVRTPTAAREPPAIGWAGLAARWSSCGLFAAFATLSGPTLTLVHRLNPGDRNGMPLVDEILPERLRCGHLIGPQVGTAQQVDRGMNGEIARRDVVEVVQAHRERHRN